MESRKEIVNKVVSMGMKLSRALSIAQIPRSTYYYTSTGSRKGKQASTYTWYKNRKVKNSTVLRKIEQILCEEFIDYGYRTITQCLKQQGYLINKKKVYRLMKEAGMLLPKRKKMNLSGRKKVEYSTPLALYPFHTIEVDIKHIAIQGENRYAYLVTFLDVFSRAVLSWKIGYQMRSTHIAPLVNELLNQWLIPLGIDPKQIMIVVRSDNGAQFISELFRNCLQKQGIKNEYIRAGTPEQNGHIEAYHSTVKKLVCDQYYLDNLNEAEQVMSRFVETYNNKRIMMPILYMTPVNFMQAWFSRKVTAIIEGKKVKYFFREKPDEKTSTDLPSEFLCVQNNISKLNHTFYT